MALNPLVIRLEKFSTLASAKSPRRRKDVQSFTKQGPAEITLAVQGESDFAYRNLPELQKTTSPNREVSPSRGVGREHRN
jgi:hypothetical protein